MADTLAANPQNAQQLPRGGCNANPMRPHAHCLKRVLNNLRYSTAQRSRNQRSADFSPQEGWSTNRVGELSSACCQSAGSGGINSALRKSSRFAIILAHSYTAPRSRNPIVIVLLLVLDCPISDDEQSGGGAPVSDLAFPARALAKAPCRRPALRWQCCAVQVLIAFVLAAVFFRFR